MDATGAPCGEPDLERIIDDLENTAFEVAPYTDGVVMCGVEIDAMITRCWREGFAVN